MTPLDAPDDAAIRLELKAWLQDGSARRWRELADHTQASAALLIGVGPGTLSRWELGKTRPRGATARSYHARLLGWRPVDEPVPLEVPPGGADGQ